MWTIDELKFCKESEDKVEFKKGENGNVSYNGSGKDKPGERRRCILGYVVALCNEKGGTLVIGMHDSFPHRVIGTKQAEGAIGQLESDIYRDTGIRPLIYELFENIQAKTGRVLVIEVPGRPAGKPFKFEDVPLMRVGEELKPMSDAVYLKILQESEPDFSEQICDGLLVDDLDKDAIKELKRHYATKWKKPFYMKEPTIQVLSDLGLMDQNTGHLNYAALVLLGKSEAIKKYLPCNNIVVEYRLNHSMIPYTARQEFQQPLFIAINQVWDYINQPASNPLQHYSDGPYIYDIPAFNREVVREAILNSICHRAMNIQSDVVIKQYPDMLIITNAGGFPLGVNLDNILTVNSLPRCKRISDVLQKTGLVEKSGQGVDKMFYECMVEGKALPDFTGTDDFQVCLKLRAKIENPAFLLMIKEEQEKRSPKQQLNVFDLLALYRTAHGQKLNDIDSDTLIKLIAEGLLINGDNGYSLSPIYDEMKKRVAVSMNTTDCGDLVTNNIVTKSVTKSIPEMIVEYCSEPRSIIEIGAYVGLKHRSNLKKNYIEPLLGKYLVMTIPDKPTSRFQKYVVIDGVEKKNE